MSTVVAPPEPSLPRTPPRVGVPRGDGAQALIEAVRRNCDRADAPSARRLSLCTYLLQMREFHRWDIGAPLGTALDRAAVGRWIAAREAHWDRLDESADGFERVPTSRGTVDPFDESAVDDALGDGLGYAAGVARFGAPVFVVADRVADGLRDGVRVRVLGREYARGFNPPVAASNAAGIVIRRDAMRRWLWTRVEVMDRRAGDDAFATALAHYARGDTAEAAVERLVEGETESLILHELGERQVEALLADRPAQPITASRDGCRARASDWAEMIAEADDVRTELTLRAVRDLLADCLVTVPTLVERGADASLHFWFSTFEGMRRELAPEWQAAYRAWVDGDRRALESAARAGRARWGELGACLLEGWRSGGARELADRLQRALGQPA